MPTYGYQCTECAHEFQVFQSMKEEPIRICPECDGKVKRLLYPVGIVFKGSGWYINDSRKPEKNGDGDAARADGDGAKPREDTAKPADSASTEKASSETKAETKPVAANSDK